MLQKRTPQVVRARGQDTLPQQHHHAFSQGARTYHLYEDTEKEFEIKEYAHTFEELAMNTANIFFEPRPKR
jgi:hypothetical protein